MPRIVRLLVVLIVAAGFASPATAQESAPNVTSMLSSTEELLKDLEFVLSLTNKKEQQQWPVIKEYFEDIFLLGIDRTKPLRIDVIFGGDTQRYRWSFPIKSFRQFRGNLDTFEINSRRVRRAQNLYRLEMDANPGARKKKDVIGYLRYKYRYALIGEKRADVPFQLPDPRKAIAPLLEKGYDLALHMQNTAEGQDDRRKSFQNNIRFKQLAAVKQKKDESKDDFALRKLLTEHLLDEFERYYVEASQLTLGGTTDAPKQEARLDIELSPIKGTPLETNIQLLGQKPSNFANIEQSKNPILSGRINFPLDQMRQINLLELSGLLRLIARNKTDASTKLNAGEKANRKQAADLFFDMLDAGTKTGLVDGFVEAHANNSGKNTLIGGIKAADGNAAIDILKLLENAKMSEEVKLEFDEEGNVKIHKVVVPAEKQDDFKDFFGDDAAVYVGTTQDTVWIAAGENAMAELKSAIQKAGMPHTGKTDDPFVDLDIKLGPWTELLHKQRGKKGDPALRRMALAAFKPGDDTLTLRLWRIEDQIKGGMLLKPGILRFAGKVIADFSKKNLE